MEAWVRTTGNSANTDSIGQASDESHTFVTKKSLAWTHLDNICIVSGVLNNHVDNFFLALCTHLLFVCLFLTEQA